MSAWSFKGVEFYVVSDVVEVGRDFAQHDYAFRDKKTFEDLGLKSKRFPVDAYVISDPQSKIGGKSAQDKRDALIRACESKKPGLLRHPELGQIHAVATRCQITREEVIKNIIRFSLEFAESGELKPFVQSLQNLNEAEFDAGIADVFESEFEVAGWGQTVRNQATENLSLLAQGMNTMRQVTSGINKLTSLIMRAGGKLDALMAPFAELQKSIANLESAAQDLIDKPNQFAQKLLTLQRSLISLGKSLGMQGPQTASADQARVAQILNLALSAKPPLKSISATQKDIESKYDPLNTRGQKNTIAAQRLQQMTHVAGALQLSTELTIQNKEESQEMMKVIATSLEKITTDNSISLDPKIAPRLLQALDNARAQTLVLIRNKELEAPALNVYQPTQAEPLLSIAFEHQKTYGHALLMNPGFFNPLLVQQRIQL